MTRVRILAALGAIVLAFSVLPASAQEEAPEEALPEDGNGLLDGLGGGDGDAGSAEAVEAEGEELPEDDADGDRFIATADGGGFHVQLADEALTVGLSEVGVQSSPDGEACSSDLACASAAGETLLGETAEVAVSEGSAADSATAFNLDDLQPLTRGSIGEASTNVSVEGDVTTAEAEGGALDAQVTLTQELLDQLPADVTKELEGVLDTLLGAGDDGGDTEGTGDPLEDLVSSLDGALENLDAGEIEGILEDADISSGAQTQSSGSVTTQDVDDLAADLDEANREAAQNEQVDEQLPEETDQVDDGGGDGGDDGSGDGEDGGGEEPSPEAIAQLIEDTVGGGGDGGDTEDPTGLVGDLADALQQLIDDASSRPLASVALGPTDSVAEDGGGVTTADAQAHGATVVVLPTDDSTVADPEGLVTVEAGSASASVQSDRTDASADFDPRLVTLGVTNPVTNEVETISVEPGESQCVGAEPLVVCVSVADGDTTVEGSGASATANAVSVTAFEDPLPQVKLDLAAATAAVNSDEVVEPFQEQAPEEPTPQPALPVTGGGALVPGLLLLGAGSAGFAALRRRG